MTTANMEHELLDWYLGLENRTLDLVGDYAGNELFLLEGDSLLLQCFEDIRIDIEGKSNHSPHQFPFDSVAKEEQMVFSFYIWSTKWSAFWKPSYDGNATSISSSSAVSLRDAILWRVCVGHAHGIPQITRIYVSHRTSTVQGIFTYSHVQSSSDTLRVISPSLIQEFRFTASRQSTTPPLTITCIHLEYTS